MDFGGMEGISVLTPQYSARSRFQVSVYHLV